MKHKRNENYTTNHELGTQQQYNNITRNEKEN